MSHSESFGSHVDPETLALLALGEPVGTSSETAHLLDCVLCAEQVRELSEAAAVGRSTLDTGELLGPDARVWQRIRADLDLEPELRTATVEGASLDLLTSAETLGLPLARAAGSSGARDSGGRDMVPRRRRTPLRRRAVLLSIAGVAAVAVVVSVAWGLSRPPQAVVLASAQLDALPAWTDAAGEAVVVSNPKGGRSLDVSVQGATPSSGYREVWLITSDLSDLVSLGVLDGTSGTFSIPDGVDIAAYDLVDVSEEQLDGDPAHSGDSIVRGELH